MCNVFKEDFLYLTGNLKDPMEVYSRIAVSDFDDERLQDYKSQLTSPRTVYNPIVCGNGWSIPLLFSYCEQKNSCLVTIQLMLQSNEVILSIPIVLSNSNIPHRTLNGEYLLNCHAHRNFASNEMDFLFHGKVTAGDIRNGLNWNVLLGNHRKSARISTMGSLEHHHVYEIEVESRGNSTLGFENSLDLIFADGEFLVVNDYQLVASDVSAIKVKIFKHTPSLSVSVRAFICAFRNDRRMSLYFADQTNLKNCVWEAATVTIIAPNMFQIDTIALDLPKEYSAYLRIDFGESYSQYFSSFVLQTLIKLDSKAVISDAQSANIYQAYTSFQGIKPVRGYLNPYVYTSMKPDEIKRFVKGTDTLPAHHTAYKPVGNVLFPSIYPDNGHQQEYTCDATMNLEKGKESILTERNDFNLIFESDVAPQLDNENYQRDQEIQLDLNDLLNLNELPEDLDFNELLIFNGCLFEEKRIEGPSNSLDGIFTTPEQESNLCKILKQAMEQADQKERELKNKRKQGQSSLSTKKARK
jgi:hypothetical protein